MTHAPLTYGQKSVWRDIEHLPRARWHEANHANLITLPAPRPLPEVQERLTALERRHAALRTVLDLDDPEAPRQVVLEPRDVVALPLADPEDDELAATATGARAVAFDLRQDLPWRPVALASRTSPGLVDRVLLTQHHMAFDAWAVGVVERELRAPVLPTSPPPDLRTVAREQQDDPVWAARADALRRHVAQVYGGPVARWSGTDDAHGAHQVSLRSRQLLASGRQAAVELKVSLANVLVAAVVEALADKVGPGAVVAGLMSSNRFAARWSDLVTSMNQWVAVDAASRGELDATALELQRRAMTAYRLGIYDVDVLRDLVRAHGVTGPSLLPTVNVNGFETDEEPDVPEHEPDGHVEHEAVFSRVGAPAYLRIVVTPASICLRLRTTGIAVAAAERTLRDVHRIVTSRAPRA